MTDPATNPPPNEARPVRASSRLGPRLNVGDDVAYLLPMMVFLVLTWAGGTWPGFYPASYVLKTLLTAILLFLLWSQYTKIQWTGWGWGVLLGVVGIFQWVGTEKLIPHFWPRFPEMLSGSPFVPADAFHTPAGVWSFIAIRWAGATLVVPVMEELFWRDFLWRTVAAPADFKLARLGEWDRGLPLLIVSIAFCTVHPQWLTALVWGFMIGGLLTWKRSLGACIVMHAVTNFLLGAYVLWFHDWAFW